MMFALTLALCQPRSFVAGSPPSGMTGQPIGLLLTLTKAS